MVNLGVLEQLLNHISRHALCKTTDKILLAVSGGVDSVVMFHLLKEAGYRIGVAHCNFQLRGVDSDTDEAWVRDLCQQFEIPFFSTRFDTKEYALSRGISTQMAARDLRYEYFAETVRRHGFDYIATAHHFSDVIETVYLNLTRGTGIDGFRGISPRKQNIIRPLLFATRDMILDYALKYNIGWREDTSNASDDYHRNYLRHQIIPRLKEMNPAFEENFRYTHERLLGARAFAHLYIEDVRGKAVTQRDKNGMTINIKAIQESEFSAVLLWELIKEFGFKYDQCRKIATDHQPGKIFLAEGYQLLVDRKHYIIDKKNEHTFLSQMIDEDQRLASADNQILVLNYVAADDFRLVKDSSIAQLDTDRLTFPLLWRKWEAGDYFTPLGMRSEKKVSDFLIDLKIPFNMKADVTVLQSGDHIVWIVGHRIDERYRVTEATKRVLVIEPKQASD